MCRLSYYNFGEKNGNFQKRNFHNAGGKDGDAVQIYLQDPSSSQNAYFITYEDGVPGEMKLGLYNSSGTSRDSAFDNTILVCLPQITQTILFIQTLQHIIVS